MNEHPLTLDELEAVARGLPEPPRVQRLEAGREVIRWLEAVIPKEPHPESPLDALLGIAITENNKLPFWHWRAVTADGEVIKEGKVIDTDLLAPEPALTVKSPAPTPQRLPLLSYPQLSPPSKLIIITGTS